MRKLQAKLCQRSYDDMWEVVIPASLVRLGETDRDFVRQKRAVDQARWVTVFVSKNHKDAKKWVDTNQSDMLKLSTLYEVK